MTIGRNKFLGVEFGGGPENQDGGMVAEESMESRFGFCH